MKITAEWIRQHGASPELSIWADTAIPTELDHKVVLHQALHTDFAFYHWLAYTIGHEMALEGHRLMVEADSRRFSLEVLRQ